VRYGAARRGDGNVGVVKYNRLTGKWETP